MSSSFFDTLESRQLLSATICQELGLTAADERAAIVMAATPAKVVLPNIVGTYTGNVRLNGGDSLTITLKITSQKRGGAIAGTIRSPSDSAVKLSLTGTVAKGRKLTLTFTGRTAAGKTNGTFNGSISKNLATLSGNISGTSGGDDFAGTLKVHK